MAKARFLAKYPPDYFRLFETAVEADGFTVPCKDLQQAKSLRFDLYGFLNACQNEEHPSTREWRSFSLAVKENPPRLVFMRPEATTLGSLVASALEGIRPAIPDSEPTDEATDALADLGFKSHGN